MRSHFVLHKPSTEAVVSVCIRDLMFTWLHFTLSINQLLRAAILIKF